MIPSSTELRYFIEIAHTSNLSRAAERLGVSQPTLTLAIRRLEDSFGQPVFVRSKTGVRLTKAGNKLLLKARFLFDEWEKIKSTANEEEAELRGIYTIGCHPSVALYSLPEFMPRLIKTYAQLEFKLSHKLSRHITEDVISSRLDFGIVVNPVEHPDLVIKQLLNDEVTFWISEKQKKVMPGMPLIFDPELIQAQTLMKLLHKKGISFDRTIESSSLEVISALVGGGCGVGVIPGRVAATNKSLNLVRVSPQWPVFADKVCLIYRADSQRSEASKKIISCISQALQASAP